MNKIKRIVIKTETDETVYDKYLNSAKKMMFRLAFALARAMKVTPKQLAESFTLKEVDEYANDLNKELIKRVDKETNNIKNTFKTK